MRSEKKQSKAMANNARASMERNTREAPSIRAPEEEDTHAARVSMLGELTSSIAHEVSQPLCAILANAETSLRILSHDDPNVAKVGQLTARIAESARRASDIVHRIRGMVAKHEPERVPLDLNVIIEDALLLVRHEMETRAIILSVTLHPELPRVLGDRVQLQQVLVNLLINSLQAIAQAGMSPRRIDLRTLHHESGAVAFSIRDSGPGIANQDLNCVFDSFFTTKETGVGVGLAICRSIIVAHGGGITVSNHPEGGAEFRFSLPVLDPVQVKK
jgi:two-component system, LuxR family, sensor kinase FixL